MSQRLSYIRFVKPLPQDWLTPPVETPISRLHDSSTLVGDGAKGLIELYRDGDWIRVVVGERREEHLIGAAQVVTARAYPRPVDSGKAEGKK